MLKSKHCLYGYRNEYKKNKEINKNKNKKQRLQYSYNVGGCVILT